MRQKEKQSGLAHFNLYIVLLQCFTHHNTHLLKKMAYISTHTQSGTEKHSQYTIEQSRNPGFLWEIIPSHPFKKMLHVS